MLNISFPAPDFQLKKENDKQFLFDRIRKKWVLLTPEEWVRQNFVHFLVREMAYPSTLIALEKQIMVGEMQKRFDVLVYDPLHQPWMMIECKAPSVTLSEDTLSQLLRYHISTPVPFLIITNGKQTLGWNKRQGQLHALEQMPVWNHP